MLLTELADPKKSTHNYILDGLLAFPNLTEGGKQASLGMQANKDIHQKVTLPLAQMSYALVGA